MIEINKELLPKIFFDNKEHKTNIIYNNKSVYYKKIDFITSINQQSIDTGIENIDEYVFSFGSIPMMGCNINFRYSDSQNYITTFYDKNTNKVINVSSVLYKDLAGWIVILYTKN